MTRSLNSVMQRIGILCTATIALMLYSTELAAQCCQPIANAIPGFTYSYILTNGTNASGVAYNPNADLYYYVIAGNPGFPLETSDNAGVSLNQTNAGFDSRGLWWNPNLNQLEANGYNAFGIWDFDLNGAQYALNTGTGVFVGMNQPNVQSCGDLDYDANEIIYYDNGTIHRYDRATNAFLGTYPLTGMPVGTGSINSYTVVYTGCATYEIGILDYVNKRFYFFDKSNGAYTGMSQLPAAAVTNNSFRFSYAGGYAWTYDVGTRTWSSYQVLTTGVTGTLNLGNDTTLCTGQTLTLDATTAGGTYTWQDASTNPTFTVTTAGTYYVDVDVAGCIHSDTIVVSYLSGGSINLGNDTTLCTGQTLTLDATTAGATYTWQDASTNPTFNVTTAGTYYVDVDVSGCLATDTIVVTYNNPPTVNLGNDTTLCTGATLTLDATSAGATYTWQDNSTNPTFTVTTAGTYYVDADVGGCIGTDTIVVTYSTAPTINFGNDTTLCTGATLTLDATSAGATYTWQDNSTNPTFTVTTAGTYYVDADVGGCIGTDTIVVTYSNPPTVNLGNDTTLCPGASLTLDATSAGATYTWQDNSTNPTFTVSVDGTYFVDVDLGGCVGSDTIVVTYAALTPPNVSNDTIYCQGDPMIDMIATALAGGTINWYSDPGLTTNLGTGPTLTPNTTVGQTIYYVTETTAGCESNAAQITITIVPPPPPPAVTGGATYCDGDPLNDLVATPGFGGTINWYSDPGLTTNIGTGNTLTPNSTVGTTTYYVTESVGSCESAPATVDVIINPTPAPPTAGNDTTYCIGDPIGPISATANSGGTLNWYSDAGLTTNIGTGNTVTPTSINGTTTYYVTETVNGCESAAATIDVTFIAPPFALITGDTMLCIGESTTLFATGTGTSWAWNTGSNAGSITETPIVDTWYSVTYTNSCGSATDSVYVVVNPLPTVDAGNDTLLGIGNSITLTPSGGTSYLWSPDTGLDCTTCENPQASPLDDIMYYVIVTDANGCSSIDSVFIDVDGEVGVYVPNIFSPNGDGLNDVLYVRGNGIKSLIFMIYDRWGQKVFESSEQDLGWDGTMNGKPMNTAAFAYVVQVTLITGEVQVIKGNVTLIR